MNSIQSAQDLNQPTHAPVNEPIQVDPIIRWEIYYRLLELSVPCSCTTGEPLRVGVHNALAAIQLWSVMKQATAPRHEQVQWLNACWGAKR